MCTGNDVTGAPLLFLSEVSWVFIYGFLGIPHTTSVLNPGPSVSADNYGNKIVPLTLHSYNYINIWHNHELGHNRRHGVPHDLGCDHPVYDVSRHSVAGTPHHSGCGHPVYDAKGWLSKFEGSCLCHNRAWRHKEFDSTGQQIL